MLSCRKALGPALKGAWPVLIPVLVFALILYSVFPVHCAFHQVVACATSRSRIAERPLGKYVHR